jgi:hypothetical protein
MTESQLSRYGAIAKTLPMTPGKILFVIPTTETYYSDFDAQFPADKDGFVRLYSSVADALTAARDGYDDVILMSSDVAHAVTSMLNVSKNRVHFISMDLGGRHFGSAAKIVFSGSTGASNIAVMQNTGIRNSFTNIKFDNESAITESRYSVAEAGEYALYTNCEIYNGTHLTDTDAAELLLEGDTAKFKDCGFGSLANFQTGVTVRPVVKIVKDIVATGKVARDCYFENCLFFKNSGDTSSAFVKSVGATDFERLVMFKDCSFINAKLSAAEPAQAIVAVATPTQGYIVAKNCTVVNCTKLSTSTGVIVDGAAPNSGTGIAVNAA